MTNAVGEDRSSYQPVSPWTSLAFGFAKATEALSFTDPAFAANWANMGRQLPVRGAYHFFHPAYDPVAQAQFFATTVKKQGIKPGDVLFADVEIIAGADGILRMGPQAQRRSHLLISAAGVPVPRLRNGIPAPVPLLTAAAVDANARTFCDTVTSLTAGTGALVVMYTYLSFLPNLPSSTGYPLFVADYTATPPASVAPWKTWVFWQYAAGGGMGGGDQDQFNGTPVQLQAWAKPGPTPAPIGKDTSMPQVIQAFRPDGPNGTPGTLDQYTLGLENVPSGTVVHVETSADGTVEKDDVVPGVWGALLQAGTRMNGGIEQVYMRGLSPDGRDVWEITWEAGETAWQGPVEL